MTLVFITETRGPFNLNYGSQKKMKIKNLMPKDNVNFETGKNRKVAIIWNVKDGDDAHATGLRMNKRLKN